MNKDVKKYKILYYISFVLTTVCFFAFGIFTEDFGIVMGSSLGIFNLILSLLFILLSARKYKLKKVNIICPIAYLIFFGIVTSLCFVLNSIVMVPYVHFMYYYNFILVGCLLFNIYSLLCLSK
jgi:hypothetical protein